ncbi:MAG: acyl-CoA dehydrogenase family protein [Trebonia sp.]
MRGSATPPSTRGGPAELCELKCRLQSVRHLVRLAAAAVDRDPGDGYRASAAKASAARLAEDATRAVVRMLGPAARFEHPLVDKWVRDARGVEFMEGTRNVHRLAVAQGITSGRLGDG